MHPTRAFKAAVTNLLAAASLAALTPPAMAATAPELARAQADWRDAIVHTPTPAEGCFTTEFPSTDWKQVACKAAPRRPYGPRRGSHGRTVGNGNDYAAVTTALDTAVTGSFPTVTGVTSETGYGGAKNYYSLQLNSGFMNTAACNSGASGCQTWQQFVYSSSETSAFIQYWLINYGNTCPSGNWQNYEGSCYENSVAVAVPQLPITDLSGFKVAGTAKSGGNDTLVFTGGGKAYSITAKDSVVDLGTAWTQSEFNIVGDGGGSNAKFNKGSKITVKIAVTDGTTTAPSCESDDGTTGETNNLTLGSCSTAGGTSPAVQFTESN